MSTDAWLLDQFAGSRPSRGRHRTRRRSGRWVAALLSTAALAAALAYAAGTVAQSALGGLA